MRHFFGFFSLLNAYAPLAHAQVLSYLPNFVPAMRAGKLSTPVSMALSLVSTTWQDSLVAGRDAVNARKIEEFVAPLLRERKGDKPKIGMVYGAGHVGIEYHLKHPWIRNATLFNWEHLNFWKWAGINKGDLDLVEESDSQGNLVRYNSGLFYPLEGGTANVSTSPLALENLVQSS